MSIEAINNVSNVSFKGNSEKSEEKQEKTPEQIKDGKKKLALALAATAAIAVAAVAIKNGKAKKLSDIKFDKGIANLQDGTKFSGKIKDKLKNGDDIILEYVDGVIQKSTRKGSKNLEKVYELAENGTKTITMDYYPDGKLNEKLERINRKIINISKDGVIGDVCECKLRR